MRRIDSFQDERLRTKLCAYCSKQANTKDHIPPKILLDEPYPTRLLTVGSCWKCNNHISADELYFACALECIRCGTADPEYLKREKIRKALQNDLHLQTRLDQSIKKENNQRYYEFNKEVFNNVALKLVRAHLRWELDEYITNKPDQIIFNHTSSMNDKERVEFYTLPTVGLLPELGSRAFQKMALIGIEWHIIQPNVYQYAFIVSGDKVIVKILIHNVFAIQAMWIV